MQHLSYLKEAAKTVREWGVFALLRGVEARAGDRPRIGLSRTPEQDLLDLRQTPEMAFPAYTLDTINAEGSRPFVSGYWLGLTGPMGPLPLHLTEIAAHEQRYAKSRPFGRFMDLLAGRMLQYFYRAWADSQPAAQADIPQDDRFAGYLARLSGANEGVGPAAHFPAQARLHYAGHFASRRSASSLQDTLTHLLGQPVRIREFQPRWRKVEPGDETRLGDRFATLGGDAVLGGSIWGVSDAFRVVIGCANLRAYEQHLPTGPRFQIAAEALDALTPGHLEWDIELEIDERQVRGACLDGRARLGWTGWLAPKNEARLRADAHIGRSAMRLVSAHGGRAP
jgi:type VI secretion system protein ImpH